MCFNDKGKKVQEFHFFSSSYVHDVDISGRADARSFVYEDIKTSVEYLLVQLMKEKNPFYDSKKWKEKKEYILRRDGYRCQISARFGKMIPAELVHHVFPLAEFPEYAFASWNLISVSWREHNKLHDRQTDELTEKGRQLLIRIARQNNIAIPEKYMKPIKRKHTNGRPSTI